MKHFFYLLIFFVAFTAYAGPGKEPVKLGYKLFERHGKQGIRDNQGNVIIPAVYETLGWSKGELRVIKDVVGFKSNGRWGIINMNNEVLITPTYTQLYPANKVFLIAGVKGKFSHRDFLGIISTGGDIILPFKYSSVAVNDLRAIVSRKDGGRYLYGVVDLANKIIIPFLYKNISSLGHLRFSVTNFDRKTAIYSTEGKQIIGFDLDSISGFSQGLAIIYDNHLRGLINPQGQMVMPIKSKDFRRAGSEVKALSFNAWHIIDHDNETLATFHYDKVLPYGPGVMKVQANGKQWLINNAGVALTPRHYNALAPSKNHLIAFRSESGRWGIINVNGEMVLKARFDSVYLSEDMIYVTEKIAGKLKWSLYDTLGIRKSKHYYDVIRHRENNLFAVSRRGYWGFIDRSGEEIIHCVYDEVRDFEKRLAVVKFHGEVGVIDKTGAWVVLPREADIQLIDSRYYLTRKGKLTSLRSFDEGVVYFTENPVEVKDDYLLEHLSGGSLWKIDFNGRIFNDLSGHDEYEEVRPPSNGLYAVKIDGKYGFIDAQNRLRIANRYDDVGPFKEGLAAISLLGHWGFIDRRERLVVQPVYNSCSVFYNGLAIVEKDSGLGLITSTGEQVCSFEYDQIERQENGRFLIQKGDNFGLISQHGELLLNAKYEEVRDLNNGFAIIKVFGKYGVVNLKGVNTIPAIYDQLYYDSLNDKYLGMKKSSWKDVRLP